MKMAQWKHFARAMKVEMGHTNRDPQQMVLPMMDNVISSASHVIVEMRPRSSLCLERDRLVAE